MYVRTEEGWGSNAVRMFCCHSDVIICAYRVGEWVWNFEICACAPNVRPLSLKVDDRDLLVYHVGREIDNKFLVIYNLPDINSSFVRLLFADDVLNQYLLHKELLKSKQFDYVALLLYHVRVQVDFQCFCSHLSNSCWLMCSERSLKAFKLLADGDGLYERSFLFCNIELSVSDRVRLKFVTKCRHSC